MSDTLSRRRFCSRALVAGTTLLGLPALAREAAGSSGGQRIDPVFPRWSHAPGSTALLTLSAAALPAWVEIVPAHEPWRDLAWSEERTMFVTASGRRHRRDTVAVAVGWRPPGLYAARVTSHNGGVGLAPFVVRPSRSSRNRVAVVLPTFTWEAYNHYDADGDGIGDTWYANWESAVTVVGRPFLGDGLPPHFHAYDRPFLQWLAARGLGADFLTDEDLDDVPSGDALARRYDLLVFPGHHEYVTAHEFAVLRRFRNLGGNLAFLSANNLYRRVERAGSELRLVGRFRRLGRPEASLVGVQYRASDGGARRGPYIVRDSGAVPWLFAGTGLRDGSAIPGSFGIEIDMKTTRSPRGTTVIAEVPRIFGDTRSAQMTYYETPSGAKVFAAGAFTLAGCRNPLVQRVLENLWRHLSVP